MQAGKHRIAILLYLFCFAVALRFFLAGRHLLAIGIILGAWLILSSWLWFGGRR
jgi:uncharacterized membrane-anchored protein YitT (DUF2179 family)